MREESRKDLFFLERSLFSLIFRPPLSVVLLAPSFHLSGTITFPSFFSPANETEKERSFIIQEKGKEIVGFRKRASTLVAHHGCFLIEIEQIEERLQTRGNKNRKIKGVCCSWEYMENTGLMWAPRGALFRLGQGYALGSKRFANIEGSCLWGFHTRPRCVPVSAGPGFSFFLRASALGFDGFANLKAYVFGLR